MTRFMESNQMWRLPESNERLERIMSSLGQPMTATQIAGQTNLSVDACSSGLVLLSKLGMAECLNHRARSSRVYRLTDRGRSRRDEWNQLEAKASSVHRIPVVDWELYGWVCFRHRSAVIKALTEPMQPAAINRRARSRNPGIRMSANNVRDIVRLFHHNGIVQHVPGGKKRSFPRYELTDLGKQFQQLLRQAEVAA